MLRLTDQNAALNQQMEERLHRHTEPDRGLPTVMDKAPQPALSLIARYAEVHPGVSIEFTLLGIAIVTAPTRRAYLHV